MREKSTCGQYYAHDWIQSRCNAILLVPPSIQNVSLSYPEPPFNYFNITHFRNEGIVALLIWQGFAWTVNFCFQLSPFSFTLHLRANYFQITRSDWYERRDFIWISDVGKYKCALSLWDFSVIIRQGGKRRQGHWRVFNMCHLWRESSSTETRELNRRLGYSFAERWHLGDILPIII